MNVFYLWTGPLDWNWPPMHVVVIVFQQVPGHSKISNLNMHKQCIVTSNPCYCCYGDACSMAGDAQVTDVW